MRTETAVFRENVSIDNFHRVRRTQYKSKRNGVTEAILMHEMMKRKRERYSARKRLQISTHVRHKDST